MSQTKAQLIEGLNINSSAPADSFVIDGSGNVGIGTSSPTGRLTIKDGGYRQGIVLERAASTVDRGFIYIGDGTNSTVADEIYLDANNTAFHFRQGGSGTTETVTFASSGNVGIGTASPSSYAAAARDLVIKNATNAGITIRSGSSSDGSIYFNDTDDGNQRGIIRFDHGTDALAFHTPAGEAMRIDSSGNVGINNSSPGSYNSDGRNLVVGSGSGGQGLSIASGTSNYGTIYFADGTSGDALYRGAVLYNHAGDFMRFDIAAAEQLRISSDGGVRLNKYLEFKDGGGSGFAGYLASANHVTSGGSNTDFGLRAEENLLFATDGNSERARLDTSGRLLVGTSSAINATSYGKIQAADSSGAEIYLGRNDTTVVAGDAVGAIRFYSNDNDGAYQENASIIAAADGTQAINNKPGRLIFSTTADDQSSATERMRIDSAGRLLVGATSPYVADANFQVTDDTNAKFVLNNPGNGTYSLAVANNSFLAIKDEASSAERIRLTNEGVIYHISTNHGFLAGTTVGAGTVKYLFRGHHSAAAGNMLSGTESFTVWSNGNVVNTNNSYGQISDQKLKENIVDANSQWNNIKDVRVRNFNFIEGQTHTQIGVVAQELEAVSPGLIDEAPDRDEDGNDLGTVTKSVKYSVLYMKAVKALQEAMERIETLEAKVATLEAG